METLSSTAERILRECSQTKRTVYDLSRILSKYRYAVAVQCKKLEKNYFLRSYRNKKGRKHVYYSLGIRGLGYLLLTETDMDRRMTIAKANSRLLPEIFGSQFFAHHPKEVCQILRHLLEHASLFGGRRLIEIIPRKPQSIYYRFVNYLVMPLPGEPQDNFISRLDPYEKLTAEVLKEKIGASWAQMEAGYASYYLGRFLQRADMFAKFQEMIVEASQAGREPSSTELTTITNLVKQLPPGFRDMLVRRFGRLAEDQFRYYTASSPAK